MHPDEMPTDGDNDLGNDALPPTTLDEKLRALLNSVSRENASDTPDYILASYVLACLSAFETAVVMRDTWHGFAPRKTFAKD